MWLLHVERESAAAAQMCGRNACTACMQDAQRALEAMVDAGQLRRAHMATVTELLDCFSSLLSGKGGIDMDTHGLCSTEECEALSDEAWPLMAVADEGVAEDDALVLPIGAGALRGHCGA
jgi:hypothetical protein